MSLIEHLDLSLPLIQAPMAGVSTPAMAAAVSQAGALGSIAIGAASVSAARAMIGQVRTRTERPFGVNVFVHAPPRADPEREAAWLAWLGPRFAEFSAEPPKALEPAYTSFADDAAMQALLIELAPPVVSFHFGLPPAPIVAALRDRGVLLIATVTSLAEAAAARAGGIDAVVAQGIEAGGHRGMFDPAAHDDALGVIALTRMLVREGGLPVIAAGGIMDGAGIAAALELGAVAAQLGTAFVACTEPAANAAYRAALAGRGAFHTRMTAAISGRPARSLPNRFTALGEGGPGLSPPDYPIAYDAGKALHAAASAQGECGYGAQWAGQGAPLARAMPAAELVETLREELRHCRERRSTSLLGPDQKRSS
jgi:nitronate monooxygenase